MAVQLGSAYGKVALDVAGLLSGVAKGKAGLLNLAQVGQQVGASLQKLGAGMTVGLTLPIAAMGAASIKAASAFEETKNKAIVVFEEMADSVLANSEKSAQALGIGKQKYLDYASSIGAALKAGGMGVKESAQLAEDAVKHFSDLASFHDAQVQDVAAAWQSAIRGQYEPIQKYFPFITDAYLKTYGIANGMVDKNTKNLTANQRAVILNSIAFTEKLNPALNDYVETSGSLANQMRKTNELFNDSLIALGQNLLPIALQVVTALNKMLEAFNNMGPVQQKMTLYFLGFLAVMGPVISAVGTLIAAISSLVGFFTSLAGAGVTLTGIGTVFTGTLIPAVGALGAAFATLLPILVLIGAAVAQFAIAWKLNLFWIRDNVKLFVSTVKLLWQALMAFLRGDSASGLGYLKQAWDGFINEIMGRLQKLFGWMGPAFTEAFNGLSRVMVNVRDWIVRTFNNVSWGQIGKAIVYGIANGMLLGLPSLLSVALRVAQSALAQIKRTLGISSPSKEFAKLGMYSGQGFQIGLAKAMNPEDMARSMSKPMNQIMNSQPVTMVNNFSSGLTTREVQTMINVSSDRLIEKLSFAIGGA